MPRQLARRMAATIAVCAAATPAALAATSASGARSHPAAARAAASFPTGGYSPQAIRRAYGVTPLLAKGIDGRGETVVLPETYLPGSQSVDTDIRQDLAAFDRRYGLPAATVTTAAALGFKGNASLATSEEVQDAEIVHTIAPAAKISVIEVPLGSFARAPGLAAMFRTAATRGNIISFSESVCESAGCLNGAQQNALEGALRYARDHHVTVFASAGDSGADVGSPIHGGTRGVRAPASSPLVTGVGGTTLTANADGTAASEIAWDDDTPSAKSTGARLSATGGGLSLRWPRPSYQDGLAAVGEHRGVPDVSAVAEPGMTSVLVLHGHTSTFAAGGTSESAPLWAGIAALADQDAHRQLGFLNPALYRIGHGPAYHTAFHDITQGDNAVTLTDGETLTGYSAGPGWDAVTGWGTPNAQVLVPLLGQEVRPGDGSGL